MFEQIEEWKEENKEIRNKNKLIKEESSKIKDDNVLILKIYWIQNLILLSSSKYISKYLSFIIFFIYEIFLQFCLT